MGAPSLSWIKRNGLSFQTLSLGIGEQQEAQEALEQWQPYRAFCTLQLTLGTSMFHYNWKVPGRPFQGEQG